MTDLQLYSEITSLPSNLKKEVSDFVAFLKQKNEESISVSKVEEPVVAYKSKFYEEHIEETRKSNSMETIIIRPKNKEELSALKAIMKALKIDFETEKSPYNPEFVAKIKRSEAQMKAGKGVSIAIEDLWK